MWKKYFLKENSGALQVFLFALSSDDLSLIEDCIFSGLWLASTVRDVSWILRYDNNKNYNNNDALFVIVPRKAIEPTRLRNLLPLIYKSTYIVTGESPRVKEMVDLVKKIPELSLLGEFYPAFVV